MRSRLLLQLFIASDVTFSSNLEFRTHFCRSVIREQFVVALLRHTLSVCSVRAAQFFCRPDQNSFGQRDSYLLVVVFLI